MTFINCLCIYKSSVFRWCGSLFFSEEQHVVLCPLVVFDIFDESFCRFHIECSYLLMHFSLCWFWSFPYFIFPSSLTYQFYFSSWVIQGSCLVDNFIFPLCKFFFFCFWNQAHFLTAMLLRIQVLSFRVLQI